MKLLEPQVPSGKSAVREGAGDLAGAVYAVAIVTTAVAIVAGARAVIKAQLAKRGANPGSTAQAARSLFQVA